ncbi:MULTISPECIES: LysE/ArgO family amino acid transporter [unclassified Polaromonas]|uniref:LysE/ArgO family amino acid transporter n=1 Tax=unclassified Polaromonas TaxID=2638319 RepID=UPI0018CBF0B2|nr:MULTISPECIES: LysE family transporter [unclassified Polaromonas]MBG6073220.1 L-lysine exporter family protein LysE/ArgO [Polaromonas sp. CG_9.7]MBG6115270.1 L-lysine exporter family protein LysE/ArgO [Polaromonas sp. CG_9.2]
MNLFTTPAFFAGLALSLSLIMAIGPQNAHVMRMGLRREHLWLTVAICVVTDVTLIAVGVGGLAQLGGLSAKWLGALTGAGAVLLFLYGAQAMQRFVRPAAPAGSSIASEPETAMSRRRAVWLALAMSWLNPHAWLDTAVLMGTASLAYAQPDNAVFGLGAAAGSVLWFVALGVAMWSLGSRLKAPWIWRALDGLVALMMWGTALWLLAGLV